MNQQPPRIGYFPEQPKPAAPTQTTKPTPQPHRAPGGGPRQKPPVNPIRLIALLLCLIVFCTSLFLLVRYASNILITRKASRELENLYVSAAEQSAETTPVPTGTPVPTDAPTPTPAAKRTTATAAPQPKSVYEIWPTTYADNPTLRVSSVFYQLQGQNEDIVAWLKIDGMVEEAVVQRDNEYYLTHNALKQKSVTGALFLDENCDLDTVPTQILIHGHNMKEGAMFGSLKKYKVKDASYYKAHPFIDFNTIYENGRYVIFSVAEVDLRAGYPDYLPYWHYTRFASVEEFTQYVERAKILSQYRCNVDVQPGDRLLTLSTCTGTDDNKRLIVMARKLRPGENELELSMGILSTSDR